VQQASLAALACSRVYPGESGSENSHPNCYGRCPVTTRFVGALRLRLGCGIQSPALQLDLGDAAQIKAKRVLKQKKQASVLLLDGEIVCQGLKMEVFIESFLPSSAHKKRPGCMVHLPRPYAQLQLQKFTLIENPIRRGILPCVFITPQPDGFVRSRNGSSNTL
jgi:hypothetical protein